MVNGYGEDNVLPHGRQFAIPWFLTSHPTWDALFFIFNLAASRIMKPAGPARDARRRTLLRINVFSVSFGGICGLPGLAIQMSLAGLD